MLFRKAYFSADFKTVILLVGGPYVKPENIPWKPSLEFEVASEFHHACDLEPATVFKLIILFAKV